MQRCLSLSICLVPEKVQINNQQGKASWNLMVLLSIGKLFGNIVSSLIKIFLTSDWIIYYLEVSPKQIVIQV
jgi:hypothetical protein